MRTGRQLSLFGVEATDPSPADLSGLLAGPGQVVRMGGTARVSVVVDAAWRVHVLVAELAARGLAASWVNTVDVHLGVRTAYTSALAPLGEAWLRGAVKRPPAGFYLDGPRLRLWAAAAGTPTPLGFLLRLGPSDADCWEPVGAALAAVGLPAVLVGPRAGDRRRPTSSDPADAEPDATGAEPDPVESDAAEAGHNATEAGPGAAAGPGTAGAEPGAAGAGPGTAGVEPGAAGAGLGAAGAGLGAAGAPITGPAYRITGRRRLARLAELVGERPPAAPVEAWPT